VLENLSKLNQQQIKQAQQPPAETSNGAASNDAITKGTVVDVNNGVDANNEVETNNRSDNTKDVEQVEDVIEASVISVKPASAAKKKKTNNKLKQTVAG
jgi:hypothetical protein